MASSAINPNVAILVMYLHDTMLLLERIERLVDVPSHRQVVGCLLRQVADLQEEIVMKEPPRRKPIDS